MLRPSLYHVKNNLHCSEALLVRKTLVQRGFFQRGFDYTHENEGYTIIFL
jgi:hypothetical protein